MKVSDKYDLSLFSTAVGSAAGWRCEHCGNPGEDCSAHHIFSRENKSVRYDPLNGAWLCNACHRYAENHRDLYVQAMQIKRGMDWWIELVRRKNQIVKYNDIFRTGWKMRLLALLKEAA